MATISNNEIKIKYTLDTTDLANATALFDRLSADDRQLLNDLRRLQNQLNATGQAGQTAGNQISNGMNNSKKATKGLLDDLIQFQNPLKQIGFLVTGAFSIQAIYNFQKAILDTTIKFEALRKAIEFTSGTMTQGIMNFKFLEELATKLGLPLQAAAEGFKGFSAAAQRAGITMEQQQVMFTDLSEAMAALQVTSQDASMIFFGFSQLMSKSKVNAQELYLQIGEKLPLAMEAAQIAAGKLTGKTKVSTGELMKMVESGKLLSEKFVPEFTKALGELAGDAAYVDTLGKSFTNLGTAWDQMLEAMGQSNKSWYKSTIEGFTQVFNFLKQQWAGEDFSGNQILAFESAYEKAGKLTKAQLEGQVDIFQKQRDLIKKQISDIQAETAKIEDKPWYQKLSGQDKFAIAFNEEKVKRLKLNLSDAQGSLDGYVKKLKEINFVKLDDPLTEDDTKKLENRYKRLIDQQEALMKAEEDLIKSRTKAGTNQDILILENRVKFNNIMLEIDQRAEFQKLELAKNNAVKRRAEIIKDTEAEQEIIRQARFKAYAEEKEYLNKSLEVLQDSQRKRRQSMQTDEQNEIETSIDFYDDKLKELKKSYDKTKIIEGLSKMDLQRLEADFYRAKYELTLDGEKAIDDIKAKFRQKEKEDRIKAEFEIRDVMVEAASIRNQALAKTEMQRADIADEAAITQLKIKKEENNAQRQLIEQNSTITLEQKKTLNDKLEAQDVLLDAQMTKIVKDGEKRRLEYKLEIYNATFQAISQAFNDITNVYLSNLDRQKEALNQKYESDVRLADGNKQKLAQLAQEKARAEYEIELKQFRARQVMAVAEVIFKTAPEIAKWIATGVLAPVAAIGLAAQAVAIGAILSQPPPVPPYKDGTKGRPHPGGPAIVGEAGTERVVTTDGKVYYTPPTATLIDLPKGAQVIPNHALSKKELFWANAMNNGKPISPESGIGNKLDKIGGILEAMPVHQINMNERGFEKFIRTPRRTTKILNNQFPLRH